MCHSGLDPESSLVFWTPAGVYPDENQGRSDDRHGKRGMDPNLFERKEDKKMRRIMTKALFLGLFLVLPLLTADFGVAAQSNCWKDGDVVTYTQEEWGGDPSTGAAKLLYDNFSTIYPSGLEVGIPNSAT